MQQRMRRVVTMRLAVTGVCLCRPSSWLWSCRSQLQPYHTEQQTGRPSGSMATLLVEHCWRNCQKSWVSTAQQAWLGGPQLCVWGCCCSRRTGQHSWKVYLRVF